MKRFALNKIALLAVASLALGSCSGNDGTAPQASAAEPDVPAATTPDIPQAKWKIKAHPSGNLGKITKRQAKRVRAQRRPVSKLVAEVYDALFLDPARREEVLKARLLPRAARAIGNKAGVPEGAGEVRTKVRKADIGIDVDGARRAAAKVKVRAEGVAGRRKFEIVHRATLWLERSRGKWKVIAFSLRQKPAR